MSRLYRVSTMNRKIFLAILIIAMILSVASAAVYTGFNNTATANVNIEKTGDCSVETLVSDDGINFTESITLTNVTAGDTIELTFSHKNVEPYTETNQYLFGSVKYQVHCVEGLDLQTCEGSVNDFMDNGPEIMEDCQNVVQGILHENIYGVLYPVNSEEFITEIDKETASITPYDFQAFGIEETYTKVIITFNEKAFGQYTVSGTVDTISFMDIPRGSREQINESIGPV